MKKKIFLRVFLLVALAALLVFASGVFAIRKNSEAVVEDRLTAEAGLLSSMLRTPEDIAELESYRNRDSFRITVIRQTGEVLYESSTSGALENHADRAEVIGALAGEPHTEERYSETFGCFMTYYAVRSTLQNGDVIVIRVAVKSSDISSFLWYSVPVLLIALAAALILSLWLGGRLSSGLSRKIEGVADSLRSLNRGSYCPLSTDSGEPEFYAVFREINELNEKTSAYLAAQKREKEKLSTVLDNVSQGIIALDPSDRIVFANHSAADMFDNRANEAGCTLPYLIEDTGLCDQIRGARNDTSFDYHSGERDFSVTVRNIRSEGLSREISRIVILTDITRMKAIAREKSDFFSNASHELKTPLTVMRGNAELILAKDGLDAGTRKQVERIHTEALRMTDLIADMLRLSNLEQGQSEPPALSLELRPIAEEVLAELRTPIENRGLHVEIQGNATVEADPKRMYELLSNLCSNAVNYNKDGGSITVTLAHTDGHTVLTVADTGIGISKEHLPRLCERFYRVDPSRSRKTGGTGLGLAIVKHICSLYRAELTIDSLPEVGTTVTITF